MELGPMLILTEKPSVARAFAEALGVPRKGACWENDTVCIVNALGHLLEDYLPEDYDPTLKKWSLDALPIIPDKVKFKAIKQTEEHLAVVKKCFEKHKDKIFILATDAEREGEVIGAEILDYVDFTNYAMALRFWVSEALTPDVVLSGIKNAKPLAEYASYRYQGFARQQADWLVGMNLTRLLSLKSGKLLHFGRVQTAILGAVHEREKAIQNFVADTFFEVKATMEIVRADVKNFFAVKMINPENREFPTRFDKESKLLAAIDSEKTSIKTGKIVSLEKERKAVQPPQLFNLTALQKEAHNRFGYSPEQTLEIAQALYEKHKCLSYPRTPSRVMGDENVDLIKNIYEKLVVAYKDVTELSDFCVPGTFLTGADPSCISNDNKRLFNSAELQDHHALIPLTPCPRNDMSEKEVNVYYLVLLRFFTMLKTPYVYNSVSIGVEIKGRQFVGNGIEILQPGWKAGFRDGDEDEEKFENFSDLEQNMDYPVSSIETLEKKTQPKKHHTFASLLQLMENPRGEDGRHLAGLGTPATRGAILQKLVDRKYILLKGKNILVTDEGKFLIENVLKNDNLASFISVPETTKWEEQLHSDTAEFIDGIKGFIHNAVKNTSVDAYQSERKTLGECPECKGPVYEGKKSYYCGNYKAVNPCKFTIWKETCGAAVTPADAQLLLAGKQTKPKKCVGKSGKEFKAAFVLEKGKVEFRFEDRKK
jgi:DNA topoisomerase-3